MINPKFEYQQYLTKSDALSFEEAQTIFKDMLIQFDESIDDFAEILSDVFDAANKYVNMRNKWITFTKDEKLEKDPLRTNLHNDFILTLKMLKRFEEQINLDTTWFENLTLGKDDQLRKRIGDFAGYIVLFNTLNAR